jgi:putative transposase
VAHSSLHWVTCNRLPLLCKPEYINLLRNVFLEVIARHPFKIEAIVIFPDHLHTVWTLPDEDCDFPVRWRLIKPAFSRRCDRAGCPPPASSRAQKGEQAVWQRRYWEHLIRNEDDYKRHLDYIHHNPVKHGFVKSPADWPLSSFKRFAMEGKYEADWGTSGSDMSFGNASWE